ncbi:hypothetical protein GALMADRAFT_1151194 [Galerina marginata CBS 339.88]|uniref:F-box domain-containing protein n=1 Tax=Galerina marginata (strain CBS 339.88) TaxID=685588 RepID=A0A067SI89_GALM3|nr:hypothetical protein GALMADRAFT_1151194 [Galerina marginata CBS 339.88]
MHTLLIEDANVSLDHLPLCLTPSLKSLEVSRIPSERQIVFASFLTMLLEQVPGLVHLTLKPGRPLSQDILRSSLGFSFLRRLEFMGVTGPIDFSLLKDIGAMPELEALVMDTRDAQYQPFKPDSEKSAVPTSFQRLRELTITSGLMLMGDLIFHLHPNLGLRELSLTLVKFIGVFGVDVKGTHPSWYPVRPPAPLISTTTKKLDKVTSKAIPPVQAPPAAELAFTWMIDQILSRYALELLAINHATPNSFVVPRATIDKMLSCPTLTTLKVGWKVKPLDEILNSLDPPMPALLEVLEFPIGNALEYESQAHVSTLRHVVECYPHLIRLQCPIQPHSAVGPLYNPTVDPLSHGLKIFSVGGASPSPEQQILIASYLDYLFPTLESIQTHDGVGAVQWDYIYRLYRMCKFARLVSRE